MCGRGVVALFGFGLVACWHTAPPPSAPVAAAEPSPPGAEDPPTAATNTPKIRDFVQPVRIEKLEVSPPIEQDDDPNGVEGGVEGGVVGGDLAGAVAAPPPPPPPPPPAPPQNIAPQTMDANRIAGERNIVPDPATEAEISQSGKEKVIGSYKLCITAEGNPSSVVQLKSTGFPGYDQKIMNTIRARWRYRPFMVNGKPAPVCTAVTFIHPAAPEPSPPPPPRAKRRPH